MKKTILALVLTLTLALVFTAASGEEMVALPSKPKSPGAGRVLEHREIFRVSDD